MSIAHLLKAANQAASFFEQEGWPYCAIGAFAVVRWGETRFTSDVDFCLRADFGEEETYVGPILEAFGSRITGAAEFALTQRVLLLTAADGDSIDVALGGSPFELEMIARATPFDFAPGCRLHTCSAEDLIVLKAFAGRPKDWIDIDGVFLRQDPAKLNRKLIFDSLIPLLEVKPESDALARLEAFFARG